MHIKGHIIKHLKWGFVLFFLAPYFLSVAIFLFFQPHQPMDSDIDIFKRVDSVKVSLAKVSSHNEDFLTLLEQREASSRSQYSSHENVLAQARTIYVAILSILISLIFGREPTNKILICWILLCLISVMYLLDIHTCDLMERETYTNQLISKTINKRLNANPLDSTWFAVADSAYQEQLAKASLWPDRWYRKFVEAFHPSLVQLSYYLIPFLFLHYYLARKKYLT